MTPRALVASWYLGFLYLFWRFLLSIFLHTDEGRREKARRSGPIVSGPTESEVLVDRSMADFTSDPELARLQRASSFLCMKNSLKPSFSLLQGERFKARGRVFPSRCLPSRGEQFTAVSLFVQ